MDDKDLILEMNEIAALSPNDPRRVALESGLAQGSDAVAQQWSELQAENDTLRKNLPIVDVPGDLQSRLLAISIDEKPVGNAAPENFDTGNSNTGNTTQRNVPAKSKWLRWSGLVAAAVLLVAAGALFWSQNQSSARMRTVALLAINNHLNHLHLENHGVEDQSSGRRDLERTLTSLVKFDVTVPELGDELQLAGGRKCKLGTHPVAFTLWRDSSGDYSLFQFQPDRFGLPDSIEPTLVRSTQPAGVEHTCGAWIWTEHGRGYVFTGDPGSDLNSTLELTSQKRLNQ
jgi:hypothetical protein